jgi:hypothetical protein
MRHGGSSSKLNPAPGRPVYPCLGVTLPAKAADYSQLKNWESTKLPSGLDTAKFETAQGFLGPPQPLAFFAPAAPSAGSAYVEACDPIRIP